MSDLSKPALIATIAKKFREYRASPDAKGDDDLDMSLAALAVVVTEMLEADPMTDPRELGGSMIDVGGDPFAFGKVVFDARRALIVDYQEICHIDPEDAQRREDVFAVLFQGRVNQTSDRAKVMLLGDLDFLAAVVTEAHGVVERLGPEWPRKFVELLEKRWNEMPHPPGSEQDAA